MWLGNFLLHWVCGTEGKWHQEVPVTMFTLTRTHVSCNLFVAGVAGCFTVVFSDSWCWVLPVVITQSEPADHRPRLYGTGLGIARDEQFWTQSTATLNGLFPCSFFPFQYCLVIYTQLGKLIKPNALGGWEWRRVATETAFGCHLFKVRARRMYWWYECPVNSHPLPLVPAA